VLDGRIGQDNRNVASCNTAALMSSHAYPSLPRTGLFLNACPYASLAPMNTRIFPSLSFFSLFLPRPASPRALSAKPDRGPAFAGLASEQRVFTEPAFAPKNALTAEFINLILAARRAEKPIPADRMTYFMYNWPSLQV
jgi:hypothetical protein